MKKKFHPPRIFKFQRTNYYPSRLDTRPTLSPLRSCPILRFDFFIHFYVPAHSHSSSLHLSHFQSLSLCVLFGDLSDSPKSKPQRSSMNHYHIYQAIGRGKYSVTLPFCSKLVPIFKFLNMVTLSKFDFLYFIN